MADVFNRCRYSSNERHIVNDAHCFRVSQQLSIGPTAFMSFSTTNRGRNQRQNRYIIGDAILPQIATKLTKTYGSEFGAVLWRHLKPQRKNGNVG